MSYEIELKAIIDDPVLIKQRLQSLDGISSAVYEAKDDIYYSMGDDDPLFRLRRESYGEDADHLQGSLLFTKKDKSIDNGI